MENNQSSMVLDHRSFATLVDESFLENLGRAPAGTEAAFAAFRSFIKSTDDEKRRLEAAMQVWDGKSPTIRFLKDEYTYFLRKCQRTSNCLETFSQKKRFRKQRSLGYQHDPSCFKEVKTKIHTVLNAVQVPVYIQRFKDSIPNMMEFAARIDRRLVSQDGKSRKEMVDAFQNAQGRIMRPEAGGVNVILPNAQGKEKRRSLFSRPGDKE